MLTVEGVVGNGRVRKCVHVCVRVSEGILIEGPKTSKETLERRWRERGQTTKSLERGVSKR